MLTLVDIKEIGLYHTSFSIAKKEKGCIKDSETNMDKKVIWSVGYSEKGEQVH